ncbi:hypothetical protein JXA32_07740 [Candidatus Sumerlaeota bacterium]|nr:hypothetical protein [Candidatus Sumerlaeota bacterium]
MYAKVHRIFVFAGAIALLTSLYPALVQAADLTREELLTKDQIEDLTPEARSNYLLMLRHMDMVLITEAMTDLEQAADADPRHIPLQFLCARSAVSMARTGRGMSLADNLEISKSNVDLANEYYALASKCTQRILETLNLPQELFDRARRLKTVIDRESSSVEVREERARYSTYQFLKEHVSEIYLDQEPAPAQTAEDLLQYISQQRAAAEEARNEANRPTSTPRRPGSTAARPR